MEFVAARCPVCGGELRLPDDKKTAKCLHCGSDIIVKDAISAADVNLDNLKKLAHSAFDLKNFKEANDYYARILEFDNSDKIILIKKLISSGHLPETSKFSIIKELNSIIDTYSDEEKVDLKLRIAEWLKHLKSGMDVHKDLNGFLAINEALVDYEPNNVQHLKFQRDSSNRSIQNAVSSMNRYVSGRSDTDDRIQELNKQIFDNSLKRIKDLDEKIKALDSTYIPEKIEMPDPEGYQRKIRAANNPGCVILLFFLITTIVIFSSVIVKATL